MLLSHVYTYCCLHAVAGQEATQVTADVPQQQSQVEQVSVQEANIQGAATSSTDDSKVRTFFNFDLPGSGSRA